MPTAPSEEVVLKWFDELSNWGRWGEDDVLGTLNHITPEARVAAAGLVREGITVSCSWDIPMIERSARLAAAEATADGLSWVFSPMVDIARDPRWGRVAEGAGEDPYLGAQIAAAMVRGYQGTNLAADNTLMACVKHFGL